MGLEFKTWPGKVREQLKGWRDWMQAAGVKSIYAVVSSAVLVPVVEAVQKGDLGAIALWGSVLGGQEESG